MKKYLYTILMLIGLFAEVNLAGGFQINEHGAKAMGLGGAFTAIANDASAIYWNSAGMTQLSGTNFLLGSALIAPSSSFRGVSPAVDISRMKSQAFFPSHLFITHSFTESFSAGLGLTTPFGLGTHWSNGWIGRYLALETELKTFWVLITFAYSPVENLSIGAGFIYSFADVLITRNNSQAPFAGDAYVELEGSDNFAYGYTFSLMYKPIKDFSIGASFRSEVEYEFEGTATVTGAEQLQEIDAFPGGDVTAKLTTPMNIVGGVAYQVIPQLRLSADFQWIAWSSYDSLNVDFVNPEYEDSKSNRSYKDTYIIRFGAQYDISDKVSLLGGVYFDKMPVDPDYVSPTLPDSDRLGLSIGADAKIFDQFGISGSYLFIRAKELTVTNSKEIYTVGDSPFNGTYNSSANLLSLSLYYHLQ
ncbi:MAG: outer membrane protein transport protein [Ignavibacteriaceae bacterium]|nr:outer membrane protein transport protein [Ignavibacteriaceae bacterium]